MQNKMKSIAALAIMSGLSNAHLNNDEYLKFNQAHSEFDNEPLFTLGSGKEIFRKSNLNNKQKKSRAKSKRAKRARRNK
jgi:hypothetical protein